MVRDNGDARTGTEPSFAPISLSTPSSPSSDARAAMIWSTPTSVSDGSSKSPSACHEHGNVFNSLSIVSPHTLCNASPCLNMKMSFVLSLDFKRRRMPFTCLGARRAVSRRILNRVFASRALLVPRALARGLPARERCEPLFVSEIPFTAANGAASSSPPIPSDESSSSSAPNDRSGVPRVDDRIDPSLAPSGAAATLRASMSDDIINCVSFAPARLA